MTDAIPTRVRRYLARKIYPGTFAEVVPQHTATTAGGPPEMCSRCMTPVHEWHAKPCTSYFGRLK